MNKEIHSALGVQPGFSLRRAFMDALRGDGSGNTSSVNGTPVLNAPSWEDAAVRAWASKILEKFKAPDKIEQAMITRVQKIVGTKEALLIPTAMNIQKSMDDISTEIEPLSGKAGTIDDFIELGVAEVAKKLSTDTHINLMDPPRQDERDLAQALWIQAGIVPPDEIRRELNTQVMARIRDFNAVKWLAFQEGKKRELEAIITKIRSAQPVSWFTVDPITDQAFFTEEERTVFRQSPGTTWGVSLQGIHLRQMAGTRESTVIAWDQIETADNHGQNGIMILRNDPQYVETLRKLVGPQFYPLLDRFTALNGKVGILVFVSVQNQQILGSIMVRNTKDTLRLINEMAGKSHKIHDVYDYVNREYQQADGPKSYALLRPAVIQSLLPDPTILDIPCPTEEEKAHQWQALRNAYRQVKFLQDQRQSYYQHMPREQPPREAFPRNERNIQWLKAQQRKIDAWRIRIGMIKTGAVYWDNKPLRIP